MFLFRVEHKETKLGPFQHARHTGIEELRNLVLEEINLSICLPPYAETCQDVRQKKQFQNLLSDINSYKQTEIIFGCSNLSQLYTWFHTRHLKVLEKHGFHLVRHETEENNVIVLSVQAILIDPKRIIDTKYTPLSEMWVKQLI